MLPVVFTNSPHSHATVILSRTSLVEGHRKMLTNEGEETCKHWCAFSSLQVHKWPGVPLSEDSCMHGVF